LGDLAGDPGTKDILKHSKHAGTLRGGWLTLDDGDAGVPTPVPMPVPVPLPMPVLDRSDAD
jgi:hypothetical protein